MRRSSPRARRKPGAPAKTRQGFDQCYNGQAAVDADTMLVLGRFLTQAGNDKQQVEPMLEQLTDLPETLGWVQQLLTDNGYYSESNVERCTKEGIEPLIAVGRESHHLSWRERFGGPPPLEPDASATEAMAHRLKTPEGRALYALRKQTAEPVFGIIKSVMGFRQFLLRGLESASGEWSLVDELEHQADVHPPAGLKALRRRSPEFPRSLST